MLKLNKSKKIILGLGAVVVAAGIGIGGYALFKDQPTVSDKKEENKEEDLEKNIEIVDVNSKSRPFAIMINNHATARKYHTGLQDAYIIYEMIVEGGITRYLALYKDQDTEKIGSVRSARHYYLDYALENDAYYVHWGWSPQAESDIKTLGINNVNGLYSSAFYRDKTLNVALEHTGYTSMELLKNAVKKYRSETNKDLLLNYSADDIDLSNEGDAIDANTVIIKYSNSVVDKYVYDAENKVYKRYVNNVEHKDYQTGKIYTFKNIITYQVSNHLISGDNKGRQEFDNIGSGEGYYITNGKAIKITWSKDIRSEQTVYKYLNGEEIVVSDGNTFIQIQPTGQTLTIE